VRIIHLCSQEIINYRSRKFRRVDRIAIKYRYKSSRAVYIVHLGLAQSLTGLSFFLTWE
jgi:hypothetical protein